MMIKYFHQTILLKIDLVKSQKFKVQYTEHKLLPSNNGEYKTSHTISIRL
jgi:hypothetical protein